MSPFWLSTLCRVYVKLKAKNALKRLKRTYSPIFSESSVSD